MMDDWAWWQQVAAFFGFLTVVGWASALHHEMKRSADALEQIATQLDMEASDRRNVRDTYP